jgi:hypothetical protein
MRRGSSTRPAYRDTRRSTPPTSNGGCDERRLTCPVVTTLEGWRVFTGRDHARPVLLGDSELHALSPDQRLDYDDLRSDYHAALPALQTPMLRRVVREGRMFVKLNRGPQCGTPSGMVVSGAAGVGKTTAIRELGRTIDLAYRRKNPTMTQAVPVVYLTMPAARHPKALPAEMLYFLGAPHSKRDSETSLTHQACQLMTDLRTSVVLIDEIQKLDRSRTDHDAQSDQLKYFMDHVLIHGALQGCCFAVQTVREPQLSDGVSQTGDVDLSVTEGARFNASSKPATLLAGYGLPRGRSAVSHWGGASECAPHPGPSATCRRRADLHICLLIMDNCGGLVRPGRDRRGGLRVLHRPPRPSTGSTLHPDRGRAVQHQHGGGSRGLDQADRWLRAGLALHRHQPGTLTGLADYLFGRTHGYITSLSHLIRKAALHAIDAGSERIDRRLLDGIPLDHAATRESQDAAAASTRRAKRTTRRSQPKAAQTAA